MLLDSDRNNWLTFQNKIKEIRIKQQNLFKKIRSKIDAYKIANIKKIIEKHEPKA